MPQPPVTVKKSGPGLAQLRADMDRISKSDVLVGIPAETSGRMTKAEAIGSIESRGEKATKGRIKKEIAKFTGAAGGGTVTNAALMFIFSKGSPLRKIPARPWIEPAVEASKELITPHLGAAAKAVLEHDPTRAERQLNLAGTVAANAARRWPTNPANHWAPNAPSTIKRKGSDRPGIDTGQLRRALTHVLRQQT